MLDSRGMGMRQVAAQQERPCTVRVKVAKVMGLPLTKFNLKTFNIATADSVTKFLHRGRAMIFAGTKLGSQNPPPTPPKPVQKLAPLNGEHLLIIFIKFLDRATGGLL